MTTFVRRPAARVRGAAALLAVMLLVSCTNASEQGTATAATTAAPASTTVRLMTYNIRYDHEGDVPSWEQRRDALARQVEFTDPDVIGLQEVRPNQVTYLVEQWSDFDHYGLGRDDGVNGEAMTVFWRRDRFEAVSTETQWCSPTPDQPSKGWDADLPRTVTRVVLRDRQSGALLDIRNTHLDNKGSVARENCARQIAGITPAPDATVIVMGDLNSTVDGAPYEILTGDAMGLKDARTGAAVDFGPPGTVNDFDIKATEGPRIDFILVPRGDPVSRFGVLTDSFGGGLVISDHFPVVADVTVESG
jgi:endonuclease/exonuclease/phosphatase family metal-dependent hydrolase